MPDHPPPPRPSPPPPGSPAAPGVREGGAGAGAGDRGRTTRLAPSPTGALHLGNARTFLLTWALARRLGWRVVLRIEDLDTPRVKAGAAEGIAETLRWLGMDWDPPSRGPAECPLVQSRDLGPYRAAMRRLAAAGLAYPCELTRAQIEGAASAPQEGAHEVAFPASLRPGIAGRALDFDEVQADWLARRGESANWRLLVPAGPVAFEDRVAGARAFDPSAIVGDFVLWTRRDQPSYQLAVVVDDHRQGVTDVVRGDDLLDSASRQLLLYRALGLGPEPAHWHLPMVVGADGRRLAKRHGDTRVDHYRGLGVAAGAVVGLVLHWSVPGAGRRRAGAAELVGAFDPATMPRGPVIFTPEDDRWLLSQR